MPCATCKGTGFGVGLSGRPVDCRRCMGDGTNPGLRLGWERILHEPQAVIAEQEAMAEGVFV